MFSAGGHPRPGQHYGGGHGRGRRRSFHVHNSRHFGQGSGQGFEQEFSQEFSQDFGQGFGQHFGQGFGQHFGHGLGQQLGHGLGQGFGQGAYGFPMPQGYAYDGAHVRGIRLPWVNLWDSINLALRAVRDLEEEEEEEEEGQHTWSPIRKVALVGPDEDGKACALFPL
ncbi:hypothetical protein DTO166G4_6454 [Paecilomyces variotii]|nr:hypothetical protein DTO166G4_6454 [Paecilomyces variotii]KAJ9231981.1 hypothetical protein DTO166G5_6512 [Paecilomyces variotii]